MSNDWRDELAAKKAAIKATLDDMGLSIAAKFVPFSQSRSKNDTRKTLNWTITLQRDGRDVLTFDYSAGVAHCPGYAVTDVPRSFQGHGVTRAKVLFRYRQELASAECETGYPMQGYPFARIRNSKPITPDPVDVVSSLVLDSTVLDYGEFESWAADLGYDTDSRKAFADYHACLDIGLKLRAAIGDAGFERLRAAYTDY